MALFRRYRAVAALVFLALSGCYTYRAVETPSPGTIVRVEVPLQSAVADPNEAPEMASVEGTVVAAGDTIVLATKVRREIGAYREVVRDDTLRVALQDASRVEVREFSRSKSALLSGAILGGVVVLALAALGIEGGDAGDGSGDDGGRTFTASAGSIVSLLGRLLGG